MMMFLFGAGMVLLGIAVVLILKKGKDAEIVQDLTPEEAAKEMTREEKEELIAQYGTGVAPYKFSEHIHGSVTEFHVDYIEVYGTRYSSIGDALSKSSMLTDEDLRYDLAQFDVEMSILRNERTNARRYYREEHTVFDGTIRVYEPCKIKLDTKVRMSLGLPARMAVEIVEDENKMMSIETIYLAKNDVISESSRYQFDLLNPDDLEAFDLLVSEDEGYKQEMEQIAELTKYLASYNKLVGEDRIAITEDGRILIAPPTPAQIRAKKGITKPEAKREVDSEFVSSTITI